VSHQSFESQPPPPIKKGREYELCHTNSHRTIQASARKVKPPPSESSFSSSVVTSRQEEKERGDMDRSTYQSQHPKLTSPVSKKQGVGQVKESREGPSKHHKASLPDKTHHRHHHRSVDITPEPDKKSADNMTNMVTALMQMAQAMTDGNATKSKTHQGPSHPLVEKFKVFFHLNLKKVVISKGERVTPQYVVSIFNAARDINTAALKASNRQPLTQDEWNTFFKFHLTHMTGALHEDMVVLVHQGKFQDSQTFWTAVYHKLFPAYLAREALNKALASYMVWDEPLGIERWEAITKSILD